MIPLDGAPSAVRMEAGAPLAWWKRPELALLVGIYIVAILARSTALPLAGEETRRALYAWHMVHGDDLAVVPRGLEPFYDRPPGHYWQIGAVYALTGTLDRLTIRSGSLASVGLTMLLIFWYASRILSRAGAFVAAASFVTCGLVLEIGRRAETESLFALLVAASLLVWHHGYRSDWPPWVTWCAGWGLMAIAALVKGTQAPVAFVGATTIFLLLQRDHRMLRHPGQLAAVAVAGAMIAMWQVPFLLRTSWTDVANVWLGQAARRVSVSPAEFFEHVVWFPFEIAGAMLPWSPLLAVLLLRDSRATEARVTSMQRFMLASIAVIAVPVWLVADSRHRYAMPLYPFAAILIGLAVDRALADGAALRVRRFWRDYQRIAVIALTATGVVFVAATLLHRFVDGWWIRTLAQPWWLAAAMLLGVSIIAMIVWRLAPMVTQRTAIVSAALLALLTGALSTGPILNAHLANAADARPAVASLRASLPPNARLVSFGLIDHRFELFWGPPIERIEWPRRVDDLPAGTAYFAFDQTRGEPVQALPFAWRKLADLPMDRTRNPDPQRRVIVGEIVRDDVGRGR